MNKKGFTLIEVIVSVVIVSLVMTTLTATLVELKKKQETVSLNTNAIIYSSIVSRIINSDIAENNGIKFIECEPNGSECGLVLGNNDKRTLTITETTDSTPVKIEKDSSTNNYIMKTINGNKYVNKVDVVIEEGGQLSFCNNGDKIYANCLSVVIKGNNCSCYRERIDSTILYKDITSETTTGMLNSNTSSGIVKYIKTLEYIKTTNSASSKVSTEGYGFSRLYYKQNVYTGKDGEKNILTRLTIGIYDGIDKNSAAYNAVLYSAARSNATEPKVGDKFTITFDTVGNLSSPHNVNYPQVASIHRTVNFPLTRLTEKFNIGFEAVNPGMGPNNEGMGESQTFTKFDVNPSFEGKVFKGYYTNKGTATDCVGTMVINGAGRLTVASNYFSSDTKIYACWLDS